MKQFKKWMAVLAVFAMAFCLAACSSNEDNKGETGQYVSAQELLLKVWNEEESDNKPAVFGGVGDQLVENEPLALDLSQKDILENALTVPASLIEASDNASSIMNAMMANNFTASAWHLKEGADVSALAKEVSEKLVSNQWMCSMPEEYVILQEGSNLVVVYGLKDQVDPFVEAFNKVCTNAATLYSEPIA